MNPPGQTEGGATRPTGGDRRPLGSPPPGRSKLEVLSGLIAGRSVPQVAKALGLTKKAVQKHRDALLLAGAIVRSPEPPGWLYAKGPRFDLMKAAEGGRPPTDLPPVGRPPQVAPPWLATDGARTFRVIEPPSDPTAVPGFLRTVLTGRGSPVKKRRDHLVAWTTEGRTFDLVLMHQPSTNGWSLVVRKVRPPPYLASIQSAPGEDKEEAWDRFITRAVGIWSAAGALRVSLDVRRSRPVAAALAEVMPEGVKFRSAAADADDTPSPRTLEVFTAEYQEAIAALPADRRAAAAALLELGQELRHVSVRLEAHDHVLAEGVRAAKSNERAVEHLTQALGHVIKTQDALVAASLPLPSSPGVEYQ